MIKLKIFNNEQELCIANESNVVREGNAHASVLYFKKKLRKKS